MEKAEWLLRDWKMVNLDVELKVEFKDVNRLPIEILIANET